MKHDTLIKWKILCLLCCLFLNGTAAGQVSGGCLKTEQLYQIYLSNVNSVGVIMDYEKWLPVLENKNDRFILGGDTVRFASKSWKYTMSYEDIFLKFYWNDSLNNNILELQLAEDCYNYVRKQVEKECVRVMAESDSVKTTYKKNTLCSIVFWKTGGAKPTCHVRYYNPDEIMREINRIKERQQYELELQRRRMLAVQMALDKADSLRSLEQYETAIVGLQKVLGLVPSCDQEINRKISIIQVEIKNKKVKKLLIEGDQLLAIRRYDEARRQYNEVIKLEPGNETALSALAQLDRIDAVLKARKTTIYDYSQLNPVPYKTLLEQLQSTLNKHIDMSAAGRLRFKMNVAFDTLGINRSEWVVYPESDPIPTLMTTMLMSPYLSSTRLEGIAVSSLTSRDFLIWWNTQNVTARKKRNGHIVVGNGGLMASTTEIISKQLVKDEFPVGRYALNVKEKRVNENQFHAVSLYKYKTVGPEAMLYSMLWPSAGTIAATHGSKGWTAFVTFPLFLGGGITSYIFYKKMHEQSLKDAPGRVQDRHVKQANRWKWSSYICFGASAVVYLGDVITALTYGCKNRKMSRDMRETLKAHDIQFVNEKINIEE